MHVSRKNPGEMDAAGGEKISAGVHLPEKILQFGTGVLLRALPDYLIDQANRKGIFNGRVLVVKSTGGDTRSFEKQDNFYTLAVRGTAGGQVVDEQVLCSSISRVLRAEQQWDEVLQAASNPELRVVISNTTEVGLQYKAESVFLSPPDSFPAKLLRFLHERYRVFSGSPAAGMVIIPTELITDNGKVLKGILSELAAFNKLDPQFVNWLHQHNHFCSSLVDRIVPGMPDPGTKKELEAAWGYEDDLMVVCEPYLLWAIEGDETLRDTLSFSEADSRVILTPDITKYKELKLRMLNATHSLCCGLAFLSGFTTVREAMEDKHFAYFVERLMMDEIAAAIPFPIDHSEIEVFGLQVLDRFRNPFVAHQWIGISVQYSSKMQSRVLPVLYQYYKQFNKPPELICAGFAAYLLFMRPVKNAAGKYSGLLNQTDYVINDQQAALFFGLWDERTVEQVVALILSNHSLWADDLTRLDGFAGRVTHYIRSFIRHGILHQIAAAQSS